ncbi:MAG TPA: TonB-dependent receptor [Terracidiphilus sp.]|nr:TonB-dependent receptor [Terracidiphilus sp.]
MKPGSRIWMFFGLGILLLAGTVLSAQSVHGTLAGVISDPTGAVIGGAKVSIVNISTGTTYSVTATSVGVYRFEDIGLGEYNVTATATGFKTSVTKGVLVQIATVASLDITLQPGATSESVTVTAEGLALETQSSDVGGVISEREMEDLPIAIATGVGALRSVEDFMFLQPATTGPGVADPNGVFLSKVAGGQEYGNEVLIDGISQERTENGSSFDEEAPSVEALTQFKVITGLPPAEYGRTTGGVEDFVTKGGTNSYHGTGWEIYKDKVLDANPWFSNGWNAFYCTGANDTPACHQTWARGEDQKNDYGLNLGGPVRLPHVYNGRDRSFFFFNWEQIHYTTSSPETSTVPTTAEIGGDFSDRLTSTVVGTNPCTGDPIYAGQIFDPETTTMVGGVECRTPFAGNKIDPGRESALAKALLSYYPAPSNSNITSNYTMVGLVPITNTTETIRIDQNLTQKAKLWGAYSSRENTRWSGAPADLPFPISNQGWWQDFTTHFIRVGFDLNFTPNLLDYFIFGANRSNSKNYNEAANSGKNFDQILGLGNATGNSFPLIVTGDVDANMGNIGNDDDEVDNGFYVDDAVVWTHGRHNFKFGGEAHYQQFDHLVGETQEIDFGAGETGGALGIGGGLGIASLFLGLANTGHTNNDVLQSPKWLSNYYDVFVQDDWKVSPNLTLNLGLRYDLDIPRKEARNHTSNFSPAAVDPEYNIPGALVFADKCSGCNPRWADTWKKSFGPRIGFAWTPDFLHQKTVVRGGTGILYGPEVYTDFGGSMTTGYQVSANTLSLNGFDPAFAIDAGMPAFTPPPNEDPGIYNGSYLPGSYITKDAGRPATVYTWNVEVQHQLATDLIATVGYMGMHSTNLKANLLNPNNMPTSDFAYGDSLYQPFVGNTQGVGLPFNGFLQNWGGNPQLQAALRPFPQYDFIDQGCCLENVGMSSFDALIASVQRHYHQGLSMQASYTWGKTITDADSALPNNALGETPQDTHVENLHLEKAISGLDLRHTFVFSGSYELPFGKGKQLLNHGIGAAVLGGWEVSTIERLQSGQPVSFGCAVGIPGFQNCIRFGRYQGAKLKSDIYSRKGQKGINPFFVNAPGVSVDPTVNTMFNLEYSDVVDGDANAAGKPIAFYDVNNNYNRDCTTGTQANCNGSLNQPYAFNNGIPRVTSEVRTPLYFDNDMGIIKRIPFYETYTLTLKAELINTFNEHSFSWPDGQPYDWGTFGMPNGTKNNPRNIQLTARFTF